MRPLLVRLKTSEDESLDWHAHAEDVAPHVVRITTPRLSGTGFLIGRRDPVVHIATAAHVVRDARTWGQAVTVHHDAFDGPATLLPHQIGITLHATLDSAGLTFNLPRLVRDTFPTEPLGFVPPDAAVKPGVEVGWLGYPYLVPGAPLCFFSGHVSAYVDERYFIDGVAIGGVSGGPAFLYRNLEPAGLHILGSITAYHPSREGTGETNPGLSVADNVSWAHGLQDLPTE